MLQDQEMEGISWNYLSGIGRMRSEDNQYHLMARVNALLLSCAKYKHFASPLKLQKMLYLNYVVHLQQGHKELPYLVFEAWTYGPVIKSVYNYYKSFGNREISQKMGTEGHYPILDSETIKITTKKYGPLDPFALVDITHKQGGAWFKAFQHGLGTTIEHKDIKEEFVKNE